MRHIAVSTEVFAEIWKRHQPGDPSEEEILRRVLDLPRSSNLPPEHVELVNKPARAVGHHVQKFNVTFPEGFEILRNYKGKDYRAKVQNGQWLLDSTEILYPSLNKLSWAVVKGHENTWNNWKYLDEGGQVRLINSLRDPSTVDSRV